MIECKRADKRGMQVRRFSHRIVLEPALMELMRLYDRLGGASPAAAEELNAAVERCLGARSGAREGLQERLQLLMRARDLHQYALEDADLSSLKLRVYEHLLHHRSAAERWAAVRELLLEQLDTVCETPLPGLQANVELYKRCLSDRTGRLGRLLLTVALFNLELDGEAPPPNLVIRFRRGAFPLHCWEVCAPEGRTAHLGTVADWSPAGALSRWEYLAADLAHAVFRRLQENRGRRRWDQREEPQPAVVPGVLPAEPETIYCRYDADASGGGSPQLDLFPVDADALLAGLLRRVHARQGPEGVKLLALLLERLHGVPTGTPAELNLPELAAAATVGDSSGRSRRQRVQRLERIVGELAQVELTRVAAHGQGSRARTARLLTVLGRSGGWPLASAPADEHEDTALLVMPDRYLHSARFADGSEGLGAAFRDLPAVLLECAGKEHPCLLPLYAWLRRAWSAGDQAPTVERTARALLDEAGVWVSGTGRYRAIEALKRDLEFMREQGWLGAWRLQRSEARDAMEDRYRLSAPATSAAAPAEGRTAWVAPAGGRLAVSALTGNGEEALTGT